MRKTSTEWKIVRFETPTITDCGGFGAHVSLFEIFFAEICFHTTF